MKKNDILKANLLLSDYTLAYGNEEDQRVFLELLDRYVVSLDDPTISALFVKLTSNDNDEVRELYAQILADTLEARVKEVA
ncbi:hypothetical protein [Sharpea porci]|uniref:hypothetical protein n=1 Tax=Sharpea porci TaxID=2652286 RepID=UPI002A90D48D|nr:hypothetical protein [Sharpea porci]MDY5279250.1 hypothetical protein [Sharpea porci]